jgi:hypothetical protein
MSPQAIDASQPLIISNMLLTITTTHRPATDLGYLLHKNPANLHSFDLSFGKAHVFYPEAVPEQCTAALLLDVDPVGLVRGKRGQHEGCATQKLSPGLCGDFFKPVFMMKTTQNVL